MLEIVVRSWKYIFFIPKWGGNEKYRGVAIGIKGIQYKSFQLRLYVFPFPLFDDLVVH